MAASSTENAGPVRLEGALARRQLVLRLADRLGGFGKRIRQAAWAESLKHMRVFPSGVSLAPDPARGWEAVTKGRVLGTTRGLDELANRFDGAALIVASGPSAKATDYDAIPSGVKLIAVNGSIELLKHAKRSAGLYIATDPDFFRHRMEIVREAIRTAEHSFLSFTGLAYLAKADPALLTERAAQLSVLEPAGRYYLARRLGWAELSDWAAKEDALTLGSGESALAARIGWSDDLRLGVFTGRTVAYTALQVAAFLGFREIGLIGADFTSGGRAYEEPDGARPSKIATDFDAVIKDAFELGRACCERRGIRVCNLAEASRLREVFETIGLKEFTADQSPS